MAETRRYELDGIVLDIPIHYDGQANIYIEDYPDFIETPIWTKSGYRVLFSGTDACPRATPPDCQDCGGCKHFQRAAEHTWFGCCQSAHSKPGENPISETEVI